MNIQTFFQPQHQQNQHQQQNQISGKIPLPDGFADLKPGNIYDKNRKNRKK
jgi:hypothetical protein